MPSGWSPAEGGGAGIRLTSTGPSPFASGSDDQGGGWRLYHRVHVVERLANHVALLAGGACLAAAVASVLG